MAQRQGIYRQTRLPGDAGPPANATVYLRPPDRGQLHAAGGVSPRQLLRRTSASQLVQRGRGRRLCEAPTEGDTLVFGGDGAPFSAAVAEADGDLGGQKHTDGYGTQPPGQAQTDRRLMWATKPSLHSTLYAALRTD